MFSPSRFSWTRTGSSSRKYCLFSHPSEGLSPSDSYSNQGDFSAPVVVPLDPPSPNRPDSAEPISSSNSIDQGESGAIETSSQDAVCNHLPVAGYIDDSTEHFKH